ncbi:flagellar motor switch phosphatase FliY [Anaerosacchariphilus polymeriproducens]|uniref:Flagellar motor switch phosphatase FliY n=1 Tax=Anaerosacchariphilus polymeriproducens TaxID=1812858 RepID=A0A371AS70_9FIRM|nr:flagellar motor switch phosphatase FliY [Anaerosacchariphilus polymeriproducens]RDU22423.1 flagellar motor switch phosphatase FliY [Anaerosacchariphilus polymeriproducens]
MDGILGQDEINALLNNTDPDGMSDSTEQVLTDAEKDAVGEIANISMGTAATTLFALVNRKVVITTPKVSYSTWEEISESYERPCVFIQISYTEGLDGSNILVLKELDVKIITDLMMGGDGTNTDGELGELHLSAISEAMNQMMGSSATSLSSMLNKTIDISPPQADLIDINSVDDEGKIASFLKGRFIKVSFKMEIEGLADSEIMQLYPVDFAREMYECFRQTMEMDKIDETSNRQQQTPKQQAVPPQATTQQAVPQQTPNVGMANMNGGQQPMMQQMNTAPKQDVNVQPAQFQAFSNDFIPMGQKENIDLIMDVPLDVTVELGRTTKSINDILEFAPGTIIELNKIAGEPIDVLVNGKYVAKGEVVVIEESFGVRVTEIIKG